jgi:hypothetical protein
MIQVMVFRAFLDFSAFWVLARMLLTHTLKLLAMKLISKSIRAVGAIAVLSIMIGAAQQPVQAQTVAQDENGVCTALPEGIFYQEFGGITFSPMQKAAYRTIEARINERYAALYATLRTVEDPSRSVSIAFKTEAGSGAMTPEKYAEYDARVTALAVSQVSSDEQVRLINQEFGEYVEASIAQVLAYTPEQVAEGQRIGLDFEAQTMAILSAEQKPIYETNLALQRRIQACGEPTPFARILSPLPY